MLFCYTDQTYKIRFHSFPKDKKFKKTWSNFTGRTGFWTQGKFSVVCGKHFEDKYVCGRKLDYNAIPILHLPHHPHQQEQLDNGEGVS